MRLLFCVFASGLLVCAPHAGAQIFQCVDGSGKQVFSQTACPGGSSEKKIGSAPVPATPPGHAGGKDWAAENAAANARARAGAPKASAPLERRSLNIANQSRVTDQKITADCEANRGVRCRSKAEIDKRRYEQYEESNVTRRR